MPIFDSRGGADGLRSVRSGDLSDGNCNAASSTLRDDDSLPVERGEATTDLWRNSSRRSAGVRCAAFAGNARIGFAVANKLLSEAANPTAKSTTGNKRIDHAGEAVPTQGA
jgi:hypothetical protein